MPPLTPEDIKRIFDTEGAEAADAALERLNRERETNVRGVGDILNASTDDETKGAERVGAALQRLRHERRTNADGAADVLCEPDSIKVENDAQAIADADNVDASAKVAPIDRVGPDTSKLGTMGYSAIPPLTAADIYRIAETEGTEAADAAVQRMARERQAREDAEYGSDIDDDDIEVGAGEADAEAVADVGDVAATDEPAPIDEVKRELAEPAFVEQNHEIGVDGEPTAKLDALGEAPTVSPFLRDQMRAKIASLRGETGDASDDPLANDKIKVAKALKKVGRTLADLPDDWDSLPRFTKIPLERSRQSEVWRIISEAQEEMRKAERLRKLENSGRPANFDELPHEERKGIDAKIRQRKHRGKKPRPPSKPTLAPLPVADVAPDVLGIALTKMSRSLRGWAEVGSTPLARQLRKPEQQRALIRAAAAYARYFAKHDRPPSHAELAKWLPGSKDQARRRLDVLKSLYAPGGPWAKT